MQPYAYGKTYVKECADSQKIVLDFTGDFTLAEDVGTTTYFHSVGDDITQCLDQALLQEMNAADIMVINNEFVYSNRGQALEGKAYTFRGKPEVCSQLHALGTDVAGIANNHVYDFGEIGLLDTLDTLQDNGIAYMGAGRDLEEASEPVYFIANGRKIAIVAATQIERSTNYTKEATKVSLRHWTRPNMLPLSPRRSRMQIMSYALSIGAQRVRTSMAVINWRWPEIL